MEEFLKAMGELHKSSERLYWAAKAFGANVGDRAPLLVRENRDSGTRLGLANEELLSSLIAYRELSDRIFSAFKLKN